MLKYATLLMLVAVSTSIAQLLPLVYYSNPIPQYSHAQNSLTGEYAYSYSGGPSAKSESKGPDGVTRGFYSYIDANGIIQSVHYVADDNGFHVSSSDSPLGHLVLSPQSRKPIYLPSNHLLESSLEGQTRRRKRSILASPPLPLTINPSDESDSGDSKHQEEKVAIRNYNKPEQVTINIPRILTEARYAPSRVQHNSKIKKPENTQQVSKKAPENLDKKISTSQVPPNSQNRHQIHQKGQLPEVLLRQTLQPIYPTGAYPAYALQYPFYINPVYSPVVNPLQLQNYYLSYLPLIPQKPLPWQLPTGQFVASVSDNKFLVTDEKPQVSQDQGTVENEDTVSVDSA